MNKLCYALEHEIQENEWKYQDNVKPEVEKEGKKCHFSNSDAEVERKLLNKQTSLEILHEFLSLSWPFFLVSLTQIYIYIYIN